MNVRKFFGSNTRDALRQVRDALGADALILSNRKVDGGVEIMAVADGEVAALTYENPRQHLTTKQPSQPTQVKPAEPRSSQPVPAIGAETIAAILHRRQSESNSNIGPAQTIRAPVFETIRTTPQPAAAAPDQEDEPPTYSRPTIARDFTPPPQAEPEPEPQQRQEDPFRLNQREPLRELDFDIPANSSEALVAEMARELKRMRNLLEGQLSGFAWGELARNDPLKAELLRAMFSAGFSPTLSRKLTDAMPRGLDFERGMKWLRAAVTHNLRAVEPGADVIERGGIIALVGPTGVGKTTTVAKLAARAVLKFGAQNVALLTTDSYRIGAHEQLRIYGRILNVPVHAVKDEAELELTLADLRRSHLVLIDTVGMSQRDRRIAEQIEFLCGRGNRVQRQLLLPATAQGVTLDDIVRAYRGAGMDGCILTKIDESVSLAPALDCLIRYGLDLHYVTNGQRVPEDMHLANAAYLVDRAFKGRVGAAGLTPEEMALQDAWAGSDAP
ncbi:flagellar biosynthesis protein FlhF [Novimethylophilus kurashikiensis]|uniref:Flagellar biosynthesis protein FlhF n=1 Tax=Novimethylophilus kurashikiensis TaxID=1825523 RepID=A0A2R5F7T7_9PROT|nr:flagellar biosynthesis protein FlhF [Novimethylophilus kurashikiensis]GBG14105.1 flagellar biosynthesis protein FlhF [Novimethylophilus kurashikiensis]